MFEFTIIFTVFFDILSYKDVHKCVKSTELARAGAKLLQSMNFDTTSADIMTSREDFPSGLNPNQPTYWNYLLHYAATTINNNNDERQTL